MTGTSNDGAAVDPIGNQPPGLVERVFDLRAHGTTVRTEMLAGLTTFLTMSYIVFVNPAILGDAGMPKGAVFVATCLVAAFGSAIMGLAANYPIAIAPGMGLNAYFAYVVVLQMHFSWQAALGAVFISGCCFLLISLLRIRDWIVDGIPRTLRIAITVGIGLFLGTIALKSAGIIAADPATFVTLGDLHKPSTLLAIVGFLTVAALAAWRVKGALVIGILAITLLGVPFAGNRLHAIVAPPPSLAPTFLALDIRAALSHGLIDVILVLFLVEVFDATGTLIAVARRAGLLVEGRTDRMGRALMADSGAIFVGALLGTSSSTAYLESAAGVAEGGRTGLTALTVAGLFLCCLFLSPLAGMVPPYATAPALLYVACLMLRDFGDISWDDVTEAVPAALTAIMMPLTYSIANGIAFGFVSYVALKALTGRFTEAKPIAWVIAGMFLIRYGIIASAA